MRSAPTHPHIKSTIDFYEACECQSCCFFFLGGRPPPHLGRTATTMCIRSMDSIQKANIGSSVPMTVDGESDL